MTANGVAPGVAETPLGAMMQPGRLTKSRADRQPILSLVETDYEKSTANLPRAMWEPMSYLESEALQSEERVDAMGIPEAMGEVEAMVSALKVYQAPEGGVVETTLPRTWKQILLRQPATVEVRAKEGAAEGLTGSWVDASPGQKDAYRRSIVEAMMVKEATLKLWGQVKKWLMELRQESGSVDALRSWQLMTGLQQANGQQQRPSAAIMPDYPQPRPPGTEEGKRRRDPRGLFG